MWWMWTPWSDGNVTLLGFGAHPPLLHDWRFWVTVDFVQTAYSLMLLPFVLISLRPIKRYLVRARTTGYDMGGHTCLALDWQQIEQKTALLRGSSERRFWAACRIQMLFRRRRAISALRRAARVR